MAEWIGAKDIAVLGLPGLGTVQWINARGRKEGWDSRQSGSNHAWEYRAVSLPAAIRKAIAKRELAASAPTDLVPAKPVQDIGSLKTWQRKVLDARAVIMAEVDRLALVTSYSQAVDLMVGEAQCGLLPASLAALVCLANARGGAGGKRTLSRRTIYRWKSEREANGVAALAPTAIPEAPIPVWASTFMRFWSRPTKPCVTEILADPSWPAIEIKPSPAQARSFLKRLGTVTRNRGRMGPRALQALRVYVARDTSELWPGAIFIGDGHTMKYQVGHPISGQPFRPEVTAILDVFTRRWVGWSTALAENTNSVADALKHALVSSTQCAIFYYDNGSGANNHNWDDDTTGLAARLSITKLNSAPWTSQSRGIIERFNSTVLHVIARRRESYVGQRMDDDARRSVDKITKAEIAASGVSRLLPTWSQFVLDLDQEQARYNDKPHDSLPRFIDPATGKRRHMTPNEMWASAVESGWMPDPLSAEEAVELFRPEVKRSTKRGIVRWLDNTYFHPALEEFGGEEVIVGYDIHDASRVWVRQADGRFICEATFEGNKRSYVPVSFAQHAEEKRLAGQIKRVDQRMAKVLENAPAGLIEHQPSVPVPVAVTSRRDAIQAEIEAEFMASTDPVAPQAVETVVSIDSPNSRFRRALDIERRMEAGEPIGADDARFLRSYSGTAEYQGKALMYADFGDQILTA